jgi:hypothetical protein
MGIFKMNHKNIIILSVLLFGLIGKTDCMSGRRLTQEETRKFDNALAAHGVNSETAGIIAGAITYASLKAVCGQVDEMDTMLFPLVIGAAVLDNLRHDNKKVDDDIKALIRIKPMVKTCFDAHQHAHFVMGFQRGIVTPGIGKTGLKAFRKGNLSAAASDAAELILFASLIIPAIAYMEYVNCKVLPDAKKKMVADIEAFKRSNRRHAE